MKYEYRKNFVDINFYGMQSKVQNPMSNPEWRDTFPKENAEKENNLRKLEEAKTQLKKQKLENLLPTRQTERSPEMQEERRLQIISKFKNNVSNYQKGSMTPAGDSVDPYSKMLSKSLRNNASMLVSNEDPFKRTSIRKASNDGQLWQLLDKLKISKGEKLDKDNKDEFLNNR